jgi:hypothetical protein
MGNEPTRYDLDDRLLEYSASVVQVVESMAKKNVVRESPADHMAVIHESYLGCWELDVGCWALK